jgi:hypothetical protein
MIVVVEKPEIEPVAFEILEFMIACSAIFLAANILALNCCSVKSNPPTNTCCTVALSQLRFDLNLMRQLELFSILKFLTLIFYRCFKSGFAKKRLGWDFWA